VNRRRWRDRHNQRLSPPSGILFSLAAGCNDSGALCKAGATWRQRCCRYRVWHSGRAGAPGYYTFLLQNISMPLPSTFPALWKEEEEGEGGGRRGRREERGGEEEALCCCHSAAFPCTSLRRRANARHATCWRHRQPGAFDCWRVPGARVAWRVWRYASAAILPFLLRFCAALPLRARLFCHRLPQTSRRCRLRFRRSGRQNLRVRRLSIRASPHDRAVRRNGCGGELVTLLRRPRRSSRHGGTSGAKHSATGACGQQARPSLSALSPAYTGVSSRPINSLSLFL